MLGNPNTPMNSMANKTDALNGLKAICRFIDAARLPSPDPKRKGNT